jgi:subtilisin family serine protease
MTRKIICLKKDNNDIEGTRLKHERACEIVKQFHILNRAKCSKRFNGLSLKEEVSQECLDKLIEEKLLDLVEDDFEVKASRWAQETIGMSLNLQEGGNSVDVNKADVDVFVLDTGVDPTNSYLNLVECKSFVDDELNEKDTNGHGTMCASIIGASGSLDIQGVVPGARIHGIKVLNSDGGGSVSDIIEAIEYVAEFKEAHPERRVVVNMSLGGFVGKTQYTALDRQIIEAQDNNDLVFVIAAGNESQDASLFSPAHIKNAITVGSFDVLDRFSTFSNYGHAVDILAPGSHVQTLGLGGKLETVSGTSFAAPFVTGAIARHLLSHGDGKTKTMQMIGHLMGSSRKEPFVDYVPDGTSRNRLYIY